MRAKQLLQQYGLAPRKGMGQNFLVEDRYVERIVDAAEIGPRDQIVEVGPGLGNVTRALAERARRVIAVELDRDLVRVLRDMLGDLPHVEIVAADILEVSMAQLLGSHVTEPYKVVANLPYNITSAALRHLLESVPRPTRLILMVQKEVAQRITATPGDMSLLAVSVQFYGAPRIVAHVPAGAFYPRPKVDSAIVRIDTFAQPPVEVTDTARFFAVVRAGFGQRRKQLRNALSHGLSLPTAVVEEAMRRCGLDPRRRAETLGLADWASLAHCLPGESMPIGDHAARAV